MKRIWLLIFVAILVSSIIPVSVLANVQDTATEGNAVSLQEAKAAAEYYANTYIDQFPTWADATIGEPVTYYWPNGERSAYEFPVESKGEQVGFLILSATKDYGPLFELSDGKGPSEYLKTAREVAVTNGIIGKDFSGQTRLLYYGALTYSVQFGAEMISDSIAVHLPTGTVEQVPTEDIVLQMDKEVARATWSTSISARPEDEASTRSITWIYGVPAWYQSVSHGDSGSNPNASWPTCAGTAVDPWNWWDGCSAIAGAMVLAYWHNQGYTMGSGGEDLLIDHAHHFMGTSDSGVTSPWNVDDGIWLVANYYGYGNYFSHSHDWFVAWYNITDNVDRGTPAVLNLTSHPYYGNHSVTVVGYEAPSDIWINDTWDTWQHMITFGSGSWATLSTFWPN